MFDRSVQPVKLGTQLVLLAGFGGLLALMAFAGIDSIGALRQIQQRNVQIRQNFLVRNRALDDIRSALYLSGTYARDYLLEQDPMHAEVYRKSLEAIRSEMRTDLSTYSRSLNPEELVTFRDLKREIDAYWKALDPIFHWNSQQKRRGSDSFLHEELFPRRTTTLKLADRIGDVNEEELNAGDQQLAAIFERFRDRLTLILVVTLGLGLIVAGATTHYILRLAKDADLRYRQMVRAQNELKELSARLVQAQEDERRAISRELHDEIGQSLSAVLMEIGNLWAVAPQNNPELHVHLESIRQLAETSVSVVRNMALLLRPSMLDDLGLLPALQWQAREISKRTGMQVDVMAESVADDLPEDHKTCIYRVVQEALHNTARHSGARNVSLCVLQSDGKILLTIQDDGKGFDSSQVRGLGLLGMEERVTHLGGTFQLKSERGRGTLLRIELPLATHSQAALEVSA